MHPTIEDIPQKRETEYLVTRHFADYRFNGDVTVKLGSDEKGITDAFIYRDNQLIACIELSGYIFTNIEDLRSHALKDGISHIDLVTCTDIHEQQPPPFTIIKKKIEGKRDYERFDAKSLILLIYSDVRINNGQLSFAMIGPMQISPSCNNFSHNRVQIISELKEAIRCNADNQWDEIWLIDYTEFVKPELCKPQKLDEQ
ncbi:MAG: hypothetical protein ABW152_18485 [Candidatus Thiodiazotropha endolucinida]